MIQDRPVLQNEMHCPLLNQHRPWFVTYLHAHPFILNVWNDTSNDRQVVCQSVSSLSWILETHMRIFLKKILVNTSSLSSPVNRKRLSKYSSWMAHGPRVDRCCQRERAQEKTEQFVLEYFLSAMVDCRPEATIGRGLQLPSSTRALQSGVTLTDTWFSAFWWFFSDTQDLMREDPQTPDIDFLRPRHAVH